MSSTNVFNLYRSVYSFKHLVTSFNDEIVKLIEIAKCPKEIPEDLRTSQPGQVEYCKKSKMLVVKCADESFIEIRHLMISGKKVMSASDFSNGFLKKLQRSKRMFLS